MRSMFYPFELYALFSVCLFIFGVAEGVGNR